MVDHITDTYEFIVEVITHGDLQISNVEFPTPVEPGEPFIVSYDVYNGGGQDTCWGHIVNINNPQQPSEIAGTKWQETIASGATKHCESSLAGTAVDLHARIEVGYTE
jgi:hypothetical protein